MVRLKNITLATFVLATLSGCITLGSKNSQPNRGGTEVHVHQTNCEYFIRELSRNHWITVRKTRKSCEMKLYTTLGAKEWDFAITDARYHLRVNPQSLAALRILSIALAMNQKYGLTAYYGHLIEKYYLGQVDIANIQDLALLSHPGARYRDYRKDMENFEESFENNPKQVKSGLNLAHIHMEMGNFPAAIDVFLRNIRQMRAVLYLYFRERYS